MPVPIERRRKPSGAMMAKRGFLRVSEGPDGRSKRPARWHGQLRPARPDPPEPLMSQVELRKADEVHRAVASGFLLRRMIGAAAGPGGGRCRDSLAITAADSGRAATLTVSSGSFASS